MRTLFIDCNDQLASVWERVLRTGDPPIEVNRRPFERTDLPRLLDGYNICIDDHSYMPTELVAQCAALKHIVFLGTGPSSYMNPAELTARGVTVHSIKGYGDTAVAEHTVALMLAACRDVTAMDRLIRSGTWSTREGVQLFGKTLGIVGLGGIGSEVSRIARGFGMDVIAWNRTRRDGQPLVELDELLARADVISLHLALNDETRGFIGPAQLAHMKAGVILVNTARAALVDEAALLDGLRSGRIRHAGLDVFHAEPLKPDHPLASMQNVTLSAHAGFRTLEASMILLRRAIDIVRGIVGAPTPRTRGEV